MPDLPETQPGPAESLAEDSAETEHPESLRRELMAILVLYAALAVLPVLLGLALCE